MASPAITMSTGNTIRLMRASIGESGELVGCDKAAAAAGTPIHVAAQTWWAGARGLAGPTRRHLQQPELFHLVVERHPADPELRRGLLAAEVVPLQAVLDDPPFQHIDAGFERVRQSCRRGSRGH